MSSHSFTSCNGPPMRSLACPSIAFVAISLLGAAPASAVTKSWNASTNGNFHDPLRWTPTGVPGSTDTAEFRRGKGASYTVTFPEDVGKATSKSDRLVVGTNSVTFAQGKGTEDSTYELLSPTTTASGRGIVIGEQPGDIASLTTSLSKLKAVAATIGDAAGSSGSLNLTSGLLELTGSGSGVQALIVGNQGVGQIAVGSGARISAPDVILGKSSGSSGVITVDGGVFGTPGVLSYQWATNFTVGQGAATFNIINGGKLGAGSFLASGTINISGGGILEYSLGFFVGSSNINVNGGSLMATDDGVVGTGIIGSEINLTNAYWRALRNLSLVGTDLNISNSQIDGAVDVDALSHVRGDGEFTALLNSGAIEPGDGFGVITTGFFQQQSSGRIHIEIGGYQAGTEYDQLESRSLPEYSGTLEVTLVDGFVPAANTSFNILSPGTGGFSNLILPPLPTPLFWNFSLLTSTGILRVAGPEYAADFQEDLDVDGDDLTLWRQGFGITGMATHSQGDADGDHDADGADFLTWQQQYGNGVPVTIAAPEPNSDSQVLVLASSLVLVHNRSRRP